MKISVSFLSDKYNKIDLINKINKTNADYIHLDVMDGIFVNNVNMSFEELNNLIKYFKKELDVHLMVSNLDKYINEYIKLNPKYVTFHIEATNDIMKYIKLIKNNNIKCGLSIKPNTKVEEIIPYLQYIDLVLVMSVEPGKGGQKFIPEVLNKVIELNKIKSINNYNYLISIDGGINEETCKKCKEDGVDILVSGSYLHNENMQERIDILRK